jgi:hypothetical protein
VLAYEMGGRDAPDVSWEVDMLDVLYVGIVIVFFVLLWGFTLASERF